MKNDQEKGRTDVPAVTSRPTCDMENHAQVRSNGSGIAIGVRALAAAVAALLAVTAAEAAGTARLTVSGIITSKLEYAGLPLPITASNGAPYSLYWDIDDTTVPFVSHGSYVWWQGPITGFGFTTPIESASYVDNGGLNNYVYVATEATRSYYNLQGYAYNITPTYGYGAYMLLYGSAALSLADIGQLDPRPLSQWAGLEPNLAVFSTCPTAGGGCSSVIGSVESLQYEVLGGQPPEQLLAELITAVLNANLRAGIGSALDRKLQNALDALDRARDGDTASAIGILYAFIQSVEAQRGKKLTDDQASELVAAAQSIIDALTQP